MFRLLCVISGRGLVRAIVVGPLDGKTVGSKVMVSPACASDKACRRLPVPLSETLEMIIDRPVGNIVGVVGQMIIPVGGEGVSICWMAGSVADRAEMSVGAGVAGGVPPQAERTSAVKTTTNMIFFMGSPSPMS